MSLHFYCDLRSLDTQLLTNCSVVVMTILLNRNEDINVLIKHYRFKLSFLIIFFIRSEQLFICLVPVRFGVMSELVSKRADLSAVIGMHDAVDMRKLKSFVFTSTGLSIFEFAATFVPLDDHCHRYRILSWKRCFSKMSFFQCVHLSFGFLLTMPQQPFVSPWNCLCWQQKKFIQLIIEFFFGWFSSNNEITNTFILYASEIEKSIQKIYMCIVAHP